MSAALALAGAMAAGTSLSAGVFAAASAFEARDRRTAPPAPRLRFVPAVEAALVLGEDELWGAGVEPEAEDDAASVERRRRVEVLGMFLLCEARSAIQFSFSLPYASATVG